MTRTRQRALAIPAFLCLLLIGPFCMAAEPGAGGANAAQLSAGTAQTPPPASDLQPAHRQETGPSPEILANNLDAIASSRGVKGPRVFTVQGKVVDNRLDFSSEKLARYEWATTEDEALAALKEMWGGGPAHGIIVVLQSGETTRETTTDSDGEFAFSDVPDGPCQLSIQGDPAQVPAKLALSRAQVVVGGGVTLQLRNDWVTVSGHVRDTAGRPVAGAKVTGVHVFRQQSGHEWYRWSEEYSTVTDAAGCYEFERLEPDGPISIVQSMGSYGELRSFELQSTADGLKSGIVRVPLVSENLVAMAQSLYDLCLRKSSRLSRPLPKNLKEPSPVPSSQGNRIMNVDIVLTPASTD